MGTVKSLIVGAVGFAFTSVGTWNTLETVLQSGTPSQPGQPSKQPSPSNPTPRQKNPQPRPQDPTPDPSNPGAPTRDRHPNAPGDRETRRDDDAGARDRYIRPFVFQSPATEGQFTVATRRLVQMEQRMERSHEALLKSLGEARRLSGARQTEALFDVIQQMLRDQAELQRYLAQSRTAWSGDILEDDTEDGGEDGSSPGPAGQPADR